MSDSAPAHPSELPVSAARQDSAITTITRGSPRAPWLRGPTRDVLLVVLGAALALIAEEWRDARDRRDRVTAALASIGDELRVNSQRVASARAGHLRVVDTLEALARRGVLPSPEVYLNGMFNPALVSSTAWQVARETGTLADLPLPLVLGLAPAYEAQERYRALGEAIIVGVLADTRRDGMEMVLRDRFAQFIPLATDFSNRERALLEHYRGALELLDERR